MGATSLVNVTGRDRAASGEFWGAAADSDSAAAHPASGIATAMRLPYRLRRRLRVILTSQISSKAAVLRTKKEGLGRALEGVFGCDRRARNDRVGAILRPFDAVVNELTTRALIEWALTDPSVT